MKKFRMSIPLFTLIIFLCFTSTQIFALEPEKPVTGYATAILVSSDGHTSSAEIPIIDGEDFGFYIQQDADGNSILVPYSNSNPVIVPYWDNVATISNTLTFSGNTGTVKVLAVGYSSVYKMTANTRIQRYSSSSWSTQGTASSASSNSNVVSLTKTGTGLTSGYNYRAYTTITATNSKKTETITLTHTVYH